MPGLPTLRCLWTLWNKKYTSTPDPNLEPCVWLVCLRFILKLQFRSHLLPAGGLWPLPARIIFPNTGSPARPGSPAPEGSSTWNWLPSHVPSTWKSISILHAHNDTTHSRYCQHPLLLKVLGTRRHGVWLPFCHIHEPGNKVNIFDPLLSH